MTGYDDITDRPCYWCGLSGGVHQSLCASQPLPPSRAEMAAEIVRLRSALQEARSAAHQDALEASSTRSHAVDLEAEVERLRAALTDARDGLTRADASSQHPWLAVLLIRDNITAALAGSPSPQPPTDPRARRTHHRGADCIAPTCLSGHECQERGCRVTCDICGEDTGDFVRRHACGSGVAQPTEETT